MKRYIVLIAACTAITALAQQTSTPTSNSDAAPAACKIDPVDNASMKRINDDYAAKFKAVSDDASAQSKKINDEGPNSADAGTAIGVNGHFETRRFDFSMDIPEVTMKDQKIALDVPEVTMKTTTWSYDTIRTTTTTECRAGIDETVWEWHTCDEGKPWAHPCVDMRTRRGADICLPSIKMEPAREEFKFDVPQTTMRRKEFVMGIPEFTMKTQRIAFDYPVYIIDSVTAKAEQQQKDSEALQLKVSTTVANLSAAMKSEIRSIAMKPLTQAYECQKTTLKAAIRQQYDALSIAVASADAGLKIAIEKKIPGAIDGFKKAIAEQQAAKQKIFADYRTRRQTMDKDYKNQLAKLG